MGANDTQVGGGHYKVGGEEHWDRVDRLKLDYFQGQITKYVERWKLKNGLEDLRKARHFLDKYIELNTPQEERGKDLEKVMEEVLSAEVPAAPVMILFDLSLPPSLYKSIVDPTLYKSIVDPTRWIGFTYEGGTAKWDLYTCKHCRAKVQTGVAVNPHTLHACDGSAPGPGYVNQG